MKSIKLSIPFITLTVLLSFVGLAALAQAQSTSPASVRADRVADIEAKKAERDAAVAERKEARDARVSDIQEKRDARQANIEERKAKRDARMTDLAAKREEFANRANDARARFASTTEARKQRLADRKAAMNDRAQERVGNMINNLHERLATVTDKIANVINRVNSRLATLQERGVDVSEAEAEVAIATEAIESATLNLSTLRLLASDLAGSENPREALAEVKEVARLVHNDLREAREAIRRALAAMKDAVTDYQTNNDT
mgnify:CR=1 FL=1|tara:strand:- start:4945 stop:5724 length:780 start_codon:yes stop_codon:yes gene_type:complete